MFTGNAKTHFQVLGRVNNQTDYMMSPFGNERWDLDDHEKLKKIYKTQDLNNSPPEPNYYCAHQPTQQSGLNVNQTHYQPQKPPYCGYIHQSGTAQGYIPKAEVEQSYHPNPIHQHIYQPLLVQSQNPPQIYYQNETSSFHGKPEAHYNTPQGSYQRPEVPVYQTPVKHLNGLNQDDIKKKPRMVYSNTNYQQTASQNIPQVQVCGQCQHAPPTPNAATYNQKQWKSSPDVPIWIAGGVNYKPLGPSNPTPSPYYQPREKSAYSPLN